MWRYLVPALLLSSVKFAPSAGGLPDTHLPSNPEAIRWHEGLNVGDSESSYLVIEPKRADSGR